MFRGAGSRLRRKVPGNGPLHENRVGRPMVRYLLDSYTIQQIQKLFKEEASALAFSSSLLSPGETLANEDESDEDSTLIESEPKLRPAASRTAYESNTMPSCPDTASRASVSSNTMPSLDMAIGGSPNDSDIAFSVNTMVPQRQEMSTTEKELSNLTNGKTTGNSENLNVETSLEKRKEYTCGFCSEYGIHKKLSRPSDLGRHLENTHHTNNLWVCPKPNCRRVFQWLGAFKEHARNYHKKRIRICDAEIIMLCPQTVFACGFEGCNQVFEAPSEFEASTTKDKFIAHILGHFRGNIEEPKVWTFTLRMRNLLSQDGLSNVWPPTSLSYEQNLGLNWDAQSGSVLQKLLETRHFGSVSSLIRNAIALGSIPCREVQLARGNAVLPILSQCQAEIHRIDMIAVQATFVPIKAANNTADSVTTNCRASLIASDPADAPVGAYQLQHLHQDSMEEILDSINVQPIEQQYLSEDFTNPMEWIEGHDGEEGDDVI
ncbi:hypothetical protein GGI43DRAFT_61341 [Trichoderma evansii]